MEAASVMLASNVSTLTFVIPVQWWRNTQSGREREALLMVLQSLLPRICEIECVVTERNTNKNTNKNKSQ
jgi:ABC-type molybdate transport system permease subunit